MPECPERTTHRRGQLKLHSLNNAQPKHSLAAPAVANDMSSSGVVHYTVLTYAHDTQCLPTKYYNFHEFYFIFMFFPFGRGESKLIYSILKLEMLRY